MVLQTNRTNRDKIVEMLLQCQPGVSCNGNSEKRFDFPNDSLQIYACIGNPDEKDL